MPNFDQDFETARLTMLAKQHPEIVKATGEVIFCAEDNESRLSGTRWAVADNIFEQATESGFKVHLIELIDNFIEYRDQCNELPKREGVVHFSGGEISIEWLPDGSTDLSQR